MAEKKLEGEKEPSFRGVLDAVKRQIRGQQRGTQSRIAGASRGLSLRGAVNTIPIQEAERTRGLAEASAASQLGGQRLGQLGSLEQLDRRFSLQNELDVQRAKRGADLAKTQARRKFQGALLNTGIDFAVGGVGAGFKKSIFGGGTGFGNARAKA